MVGPEGLIVLGTSAPLALKILGPTADYVGDELQNWTERRLHNIGRIFNTAERRLGKEVDEPGAVPPRVLREVMEEGSYWDDELGSEYFGGILASSRTATPYDDRAAVLAALVGRLSTYQLRCHYVLYVQAQRLLRGKNVALERRVDIKEEWRVFIPFQAWREGMGFELPENKLESTDYSWAVILGHCISGLKREDLISNDYVGGSPHDLQVQVENRVFPEDGLVYGVSMLGVELFCFAHGLSADPRWDFIDPDQSFTVKLPIELKADSAKLVRNLPSAR